MIRLILLTMLAIATPAGAICLDPYGCDTRSKMEQLADPTRSYDYSVANPASVAPTDPYYQQQRIPQYGDEPSYGSRSRSNCIPSYSNDYRC